MIARPERDWIAHGRIVSVDFEEKTLELRFEGDLQPLVKGRYALVSADALHMMMLRLRAKDAT